MTARAIRAAPLALLLLAGVAVADEVEAVERVARVGHVWLKEISGIACSRTHPGVYWVHNDSGDRARLFAIDAEGRVVIPGFLQDRFHGEKAVEGRRPWPGIGIPNASNVDWEDVALADGQIFVADVGNNANARRDLGIYVVNEPNPRLTQSARALRFLPVRYPEQERFPPDGPWVYDSEALFVSEGKLYLLTRHRRQGEPLGFTGGTRLYRLDTEYTDRENALTYVDARAGVGAVGGADLSPDGHHLAVLTYRALWVFERPLDGDRWLSGRARRLELALEQTKQAEAVCWDDDATLRVANEQGEIFRVPLAALVEVPPAGGS